MSDDDWNHRSQFLDAKARKTRSVSEAVNTRKKGERVDRHEEAHMLADADGIEADTESDDVTKWG